jgi:hypothetical protein
VHGCDAGLPRVDDDAGNRGYVPEPHEHDRDRRCSLERWPVGSQPAHQRIGTQLRWLRRPAVWIRSLVHAQTQQEIEKRLPADATHR